MRWNRLNAIGLDDRQIKDFLIFGNQKHGDTMAIAMRPADAKVWSGKVPPVMSVIPRPRTSFDYKGTDSLYTLLRGYYRDADSPDMFTISQTYGIAIEYTDYTYSPNQNFLDRNLTFSNEFQFRPTRRIDLRWEYALHLHDSGSYLPDEVTGERLLDVDSEDRRDRMRIRMDFKATDNIKIYAENVYSQREDRTPGSDDVSDNTDGSVMISTNTEYDWGNGRKLKFLVGRVKRFSEFGADAEKNFWDARSEFSYPF